jgi:hypothetical protein
MQIAGERKIGHKAAILLTLTEGANVMEKIGPSEYALLVKRYTEPLKDKIERIKNERENSNIPVIDREKLRERKELEDMDKYFIGVLRQWESHKDFQWRLKNKVMAEKWKEKLESARDLLSKIATEDLEASRETI